VDKKAFVGGGNCRIVEAERGTYRVRKKKLNNKRRKEGKNPGLAFHRARMLRNTEEKKSENVFKVSGEKLKHAIAEITKHRKSLK